MPTKDDLKYFQAMPLALKIKFSFQRMREWTREFGGNGVYVSFSGGKDSTVLADLYAQFCKEWGYEMWLVFVNTGLEYPEIQKFVKWYAQHLRDKYGITVHLEILRPQMRFDEVIKTNGYPIISKEVSNTIRGARESIKKGVYSHRLCKLGVEPDEYGGLTDSGEHDYKAALAKSKFRKNKYKPLIDTDFLISERCCDVMKKAPFKDFEKRTGKKPLIATMTQESMSRETAWLKNGCNAFDSKRPSSKPMSFWTNQDVLQYIKQNNIPIAPVYGEVVYATEPEQMRLEDFGVSVGGTEPLVTTGCSRTGCIFCAFGCQEEIGISRFQRLKETRPRQYAYCIGGGEYVDGIWQPNGQGLGMGHVFDELNKIYGDGFIKY
jgi:3'-phosphoadenosine 5'-phosphosulfate sulfotransferase (PAPS reductase)/FAD synthetase